MGARMLRNQLNREGFTVGRTHVSTLKLADACTTVGSLEALFRTLKDPMPSNITTWRRHRTGNRCALGLDAV